MKTYNELSKRSEEITNSLSHIPTRYIFVEFSAEMFSEIDRLNRAIKRLTNELNKGVYKMSDGWDVEVQCEKQEDILNIDLVKELRDNATFCNKVTGCSIKKHLSERAAEEILMLRRQLDEAIQNVVPQYDSLIGSMGA